MKDHPKQIHPAIVAAISFLIGAHPPIPAEAAEITLEPAKDVTLYEGQQGEFANGAGSHFFAGNNFVPEIRRGVVAFDLSVIPPGSIINSVELQLFMSRTISGSQNVRLHAALTDWGEGASDASGNEGAGTTPEPGDATWIHTFFDTQFWSQPGGDFTPTPSASQSVGGIGYYFWSASEMVADVQAWTNNPASNFGWVVVGNESTNATAKRFDSRTNSDPDRRPKLTVDFTITDSTGACCFEDGACSFVLDTDCAALGGDYQGDGVFCVPNPCPQPTGACCLPELSCQVEQAAACTKAGGIYIGDDTSCDPETCEAIVGACCFNNATCAELPLGDCDSQSGTYQGYGTICDPELCPLVLTPFIDPLPIPAVATPTSGTQGGEATYDIAMRQFTQQLHSELPPTTVWGYGDGPTGGTYPGPTIEAAGDQLVTVVWRNDLRDEVGDLRTDHYLDVDLCPHDAQNLPKSVVHLHGTHAPAEFDGYPESTFLPGQLDVYQYPNHQLPATLWYHDHALGITRLNVYMGLAGFYLIRDQFELDLELPAGEFEIPLVIQDRSFNPDGSLKYPSNWQDHFFGQFVLVNGKVWPRLGVKQGKYRFRILNGSTPAPTLTLSNGATFKLIGTDGGLLPEPVTMSEITLVSAERADLIVDFAGLSAGTEILLTNSAPGPFPGIPGEGVIPEVMKFIVLPETGYTNDIPEALRPIEILPEQDAVQSRDFELAATTDPCTGNRWLINGLHWDDVTELPVLGTSEVWRFINPTGISHPMHLHLVSFQVLDTQDFIMVDDEVVPVGDPAPPPPHLAGWKDTVEVAPNQIVRVIARFEDYLGLFAYHCHILEHEDHEMMRQFRTVECTTNAHCSDGQFCNGNEVCNLDTFTCQPGPPANCADLFPCTIDSCDPGAGNGAGGCVNQPDDSLCDNGLFCDGHETCFFTAGCIDGTPPCDPPLSCDETLNACTGCSENNQCQDDNVCTTDACDAGVCTAELAYDPLVECCTPGTGQITIVDDGDPCTTDTCNTDSGVVSHVPQGELCAVGLGCRYIRITPGTTPGVPVAILVSDSTETCFQKYVQADFTLGDVPVYRTPTQWGAVDAFGEEIVPQSQYGVQLDDGSSLTNAIIASTNRFGDVDGNDVANFADVQQVVLMFQTSIPFSPAGDIKPCLPNSLANFEDILAAVQGFQGIAYTDAACTDPCS